MSYYRSLREAPKPVFFFSIQTVAVSNFFGGSGLTRAEGPGVNPAREGGDFETP